MNLEWMGRYRELVRSLIYYSNISNKASTKKTMPPVDGIALSKKEYQVLEYICEFEDKNRIMTDISRDLGMLQSIVTKITQELLSYGLIERYRTVGNRKNIILKPTSKGKQVYIEYYTRDIKPLFDPFFHFLDSLSDEELEHYNRSIEILSGKWRDFACELEKIDDEE